MPFRDGVEEAGRQGWNIVNSSLILHGMIRTASFGTARHPFRATLPLRALRTLPRYEPEVRARMEEAELADDDDAHGAPRKKPLLTIQDAKDFLLAYCACFMAASAFLS